MPRISGVIEEVLFEEGQRVQSGDVLFRLDDREFINNIMQIKAKIDGAKAAYKQAKRENDRAASLLISKGISQEQANARTSVYNQRSAQLHALEAELASAELALSYTSVTSPINGLVSNAFITKGNHVISGQSALTSIVSNKEMHAYFDVDERTWHNKLSHQDISEYDPVALQQLGETRFTYIGYIDFINNKIDVRTGTIKVRAVFKQEGSTLKAGAFVRVRVPQGKAIKRVIIPEKAIGTDLQNQYVLRVNAQNTLQYTHVETGQRYGSYREIIAGLNQDDVIVLNGPGRATDGMEITPENITLNIDNIPFVAADVEHSLLVRR